MTSWTDTQAKLSSHWAERKPQLIALAIGLIAGPLISNYAGWQVTSGNARAQVRAGIVEQQASYCDVRARTAVAAPGKLEWSARNELARKWAAMPGTDAVDSEVANACERKLQI
jgi:hypothetical protein